MLKVSILVTIFWVFALLSEPIAQPCASYGCDSAVVRAILDVNGLDTVKVASVSSRGSTSQRIETLDLSNRNITALPKEIGRLSGVFRLYLRINPLSALPNEIGELANVEQLYLGFANLASLPDSIVNLQKVSILELRFNHLCSLTEAQLNWIDSSIWEEDADWRLSQECSSSIIINTKNALPGMRMLTLKVNGPDIILTWIPYTEVDLSRYKIYRTPFTRPDPRYLYVSNQIASLNNNTTHYTDAGAAGKEYVYSYDCYDFFGNESVAFHACSMFPDSANAAGNDSNVIRNILDINGLNAIKIKDVAEFGYGRAVSLTLDNLKLTVLPERIGFLHNLQRLSLKNNLLTNLPAAIGCLFALEELRVANNNLNTLPGTIVWLQNLRLLELECNQLSSLSDTAKIIADSLDRDWPETQNCSGQNRSNRTMQPQRPALLVDQAKRGILYTIANDCFVSIHMYDLNGKMLSRIVHERQNRGEHYVSLRNWPSKNAMFLIKVTAGEQLIVKKVVFIY